MRIHPDLDRSRGPQAEHRRTLLHRVMHALRAEDHRARGTIALQCSSQPLDLYSVETRTKGEARVSSAPKSRQVGHGGSGAHDAERAIPVLDVLIVERRVALIGQAVQRSHRLALDQ